MVDYDEILKYIQEEIIPKYDELELCSMHVLPKEFINADVEYIFKIPFNLLKDNREKLIQDILRDICSSFEIDSTRKILIILSEF